MVYHGFWAIQLVQKTTTFLHPVPSSVSAALQVEREEPGGKSLLTPATAKKTKHCDSGFSSMWLDEFP